MHTGKLWLLAVFLGEALTGCGSPQLAADITAADMPCETQQWASLQAKTQCETVAERSVLAAVEPSTLPLFEQMAAQRDSLAREYDRGEITRQQFDFIFNQVGTQFASARQQMLAGNVPTGFAQGVAIAAQARANSDAARSQAIQQYGIKTQHTTCDVVFGQTQCTTTNY